MYIKIRKISLKVRRDRRNYNSKAKGWTTKKRPASGETGRLDTN